MIKHKKKPCKGIGKAKDFKGCGKEIFKRVHGLCQSCYSDWLMNTHEGLEKLSRATLKVKQPRVELEIAKAERKSKDKLQYLKVNVMNTCHDYIKLRDKGRPCVSCGQPWSSDHQAGHWKKASDYSLLKYDERNIHNQCQGCNLFKDGNVQEYGNRIHLRIGEEGKKEVEKIAAKEKQTSFKWDRQKLNAIREYYKEKIKSLKQNQ